MFMSSAVQVYSTADASAAPGTQPSSVHRVEPQHHAHFGVPCGSGFGCNAGTQAKQIVKWWNKKCSSCRTIAFASSIKDSKALIAEFKVRKLLQVMLI